MKINITGLDSFTKNLQKTGEQIKQTVEGQVSLAELFNPEFIQHHTNFASAEEFLTACGIGLNDDFDQISDATMDSHVQSLTKFQSWDDMIGCATEKYIEKKLSSL